MLRRVKDRIVAVAGVLALSSIFTGILGARPASQHVTLTGQLSCSMCVLPNTCRAQTRRSRVSWWVNQSAAYVLVVGTRNYRLLGADKELAPFAGDTVTVTGNMFRSDVTLTSVEGMEIRKRVEK
jgi:hypothetical protein